MSHENEIETDPKISKILTDVKNKIDELGIVFATIREHILQLAKYLDEEKKYQRDRISVLIKNLLAEKVKEAKITARWIEGCLPKEYKRKYAKSEESSLTSYGNNSEPQSSIIVHENDDTIGFRANEIEQSRDSNMEISANLFSAEEQAKKIIELEQALLESSKFRRAHELEEQFEIPKLKQIELNEAFADCTNIIFVKFDANNKLKSIQPDSFNTENEDFVIDDSASDSDK